MRPKYHPEQARAQAVVPSEYALAVRAVRLATCCGLMLLNGCPQMLEDDFDDGRNQVDVPGGAGTSSDAGVGGNGAMAGSGGVVGSAGTEDDIPTDQAIVVSTLPADGARGVLPSAALLVEF